MKNILSDLLIIIYRAFLFLPFNVHLKPKNLIYYFGKLPIIFLPCGSNFVLKRKNVHFFAIHKHIYHSIKMNRTELNIYYMENNAGKRYKKE